MAMTGKNRIMIYGPKDDGTYVVEFRTAAGRCAGDLNPENQDGRDPALSGADAVWAIRAGGDLKPPGRAPSSILTSALPRRSIRLRRSRRAGMRHA
jgi:hypothetical protein